MVASLMVPYYAYTADAPISDAFNTVNLAWVGSFTTAGAIISLLTWYSNIFEFLMLCVFNSHIFLFVVKFYLQIKFVLVDVSHA
jgi:hypothetical protein